jgi:hypothetical protein
MISQLEWREMRDFQEPIALRLALQSEVQRLSPQVIQRYQAKYEVPQRGELLAVFGREERNDDALGASAR